MSTYTWARFVERGLFHAKDLGAVYIHCRTSGQSRKKVSLGSGGNGYSRATNALFA